MSDVNRLHDLFLTAAETDRRMPPAMRRQKLSSWPDYPLDWHGYGWTQEGETILKPTSRQITDYDRAMQLTILMPEDDRKLVWAVAHSAAFKARGDFRDQLVENFCVTKVHWLSPVVKLPFTANILYLTLKVKYINAEDQKISARVLSTARNLVSFRYAGARYGCRVQPDATSATNQDMKCGSISRHKLTGLLLEPV